MSDSQSNLALGVPPQPIRYFFDEHVRRRIALFLRKYGVDVLTTGEAGRADQSIDDDAQVAFATSVQRVFVSNDTDVLNPNTVPQVATGQPTGLVYIEQSVGIGEQGRFLRYLFETETLESIAGQIRFYQPIP